MIDRDSNIAGNYHCTGCVYIIYIYMHNIYIKTFLKFLKYLSVSVCHSVYFTDSAICIETFGTAIFLKINVWLLIYTCSGVRHCPPQFKMQIWQQHAGQSRGLFDPFQWSLSFNDNWFVIMLNYVVLFYRLSYNSPLQLQTLNKTWK